MISFSPIGTIVGRELVTIDEGKAENELEDGEGDSTCVVFADGTGDGCTDGFVVRVDGFDDGEGTRGSIVGIVDGMSKCVVVGVGVDSFSVVGVIEGIPVLFCNKVDGTEKDDSTDGVCDCMGVRWRDIVFCSCIDDGVSLQVG